MPRLKRSDRQAFPSTLRGEHYFLVLYDTPFDRLREKLSKACLDYGLLRVQQSCFMGCISELRAQALWSKLVRLGRDQAEPEDLARVSVIRLDQGQLWPGLHRESPGVQLVPPELALNPTHAQRYLVSAVS